MLDTLVVAVYFHSVSLSLTRVNFRVTDGAGLGFLWPQNKDVGAGKGRNLFQLRVDIRTRLPARVVVVVIVEIDTSRSLQGVSVKVPHNQSKLFARSYQCYRAPPQNQAPQFNNGSRVGSCQPYTDHDVPLGPLRLETWIYRPRFQRALWFRHGHRGLASIRPLRDLLAQRLQIPNYALIERQLLRQLLLRRTPHRMQPIGLGILRGKEYVLQTRPGRYRELDAERVMETWNGVGGFNGRPRRDRSS
jgi:hypothetical protein